MKTVKGKVVVNMVGVDVPIRYVAAIGSQTHVLEAYFVGASEYDLVPAVQLPAAVRVAINEAIAADVREKDVQESGSLWYRLPSAERSQKLNADADAYRISVLESMKAARRAGLDK